MAPRPTILSMLELKLSPVMTTVLLAGAMWWVARATPGIAFPAAGRWAGFLTLSGVGGAVALAGVLSFHRARTTVNPWRPHASSALVTSGVYRRTRNPMYLGLMLALAGWGLLLANVYALLTAFVFIPYMNRFQIRPEERALEQAFGQNFVDYCQHVRRWL